MKLFISLIVLLLVISIPASSLAQTQGTSPMPIDKEDTIPNFEGNYITTNSSTYNKSNLLDSHPTNKPIKHYEMYSILQDIDDAFTEGFQNLDSLTSKLYNIISQLNLLQQTVTNNTSSINQLDSDVYYLMNETYDIYESAPFKSVMRDHYKMQWIKLYEKEFNIYVTSPIHISNVESMLTGNTTIYNYTQALFDIQSERLTKGQLNYNAWITAHPDYDPSIEDLTIANSTLPGLDRFNFQYNTVKDHVDQPIIAMAKIHAFNSTIPENLFIKGIGMMEEPWQQ